MSDIDQIEAGREAWARVNEATSFSQWKTICLALSIGRQFAFRTSGCNAPHGVKYSRAFNGWVATHGFETMPFGTRAACIRVADNIVAIEAWRASIPETERATQNNPEVILRSWRRATRPAQKPSHAPVRQVVQGSRKLDKTNKVFWPQSAIKAAADAMKGSRSSDWYTLARCALEAAVPDATALLDVLPDPPKPTTRSAKAMPAAMSLSM